ncbi:MAG: hypothetical protein AAGL69_08500 [Pseudomonadota bacterium]
MLSAIRKEVALMLDGGKDADEILATKPSVAFDASANANGFLTPDQFVISVIKSLDAQ